MSEDSKETNESMCRNQLGSILSYFSMLDELKKVKGSKRQKFLKIIEDNKIVALLSLNFLKNKILLDENIDDDFLIDYDISKLYNADPTCNHKIIDAPGGGVKCKFCKGWFCY